MFKQNELAQVMLLRKEFISQDLKQTMKSSSTSWILNYELFSENIITEDEFKEKLTIHQNLNMYNKLKQNGIHFANSNKQTGTGEDEINHLLPLIKQVSIHY